MSQSNGKKIIHIHLGEDDFETTLTAGDHELISDEPEDMGGKDRGPDPYDYLLMSLGSCTVITLRMYAKRKKWPVEDIFMELRHHKDHAEDCIDCDEKSAKIDKIDKEILIKGDLDQDQLDKLLEISHKCPVNRTLMGTVEMKSTIEKK